MSRRLSEEALADALLARALARMGELEGDLAGHAPPDQEGPVDALEAEHHGAALEALAMELEDLGWVLALLTAVAQPAGRPRRAALAEVRHHPEGLAILERLAGAVGGTPIEGAGGVASEPERTVDALGPGRGGTGSPATIWSTLVRRLTGS